MGKPQDDWNHAILFRFALILQANSDLRKHKIYVEPIHPFLKTMTGTEGKKKNTVLNRFSDVGYDDAMGLDTWIMPYDKSIKKPGLIRRFEDKDTFIKKPDEMSESDLKNYLRNCWLWFADDCINSGLGRCVSYHLTTFAYCFDERRIALVDARDKSNPYRYNLRFRNGKLVTPKDFPPYKMYGDTDRFFDETPSYIDAIRDLFK